LKKASYLNNKVFEILALEFLKYYSLNYLQAVIDGKYQEVTFKVDTLLTQQTPSGETIRLYLLKNLLNIEKQMTSIKENYLDNKKCRWLEHFKVMVSGKTFDLLVPPDFE
jgi:hypothetical protein